MAGQQPYFFYSNKCANCSQVIETLKGLNKSGLYKFILVESLARNQIPSFLKKVPTLYLPETKEVIVGKGEIFAQIAKPTNARKELPTKQEVASGGSSEQIMGDISAWGFEGGGNLTEHYSDWNTPTSFTGGGGSMYTFLNDGAGTSAPAGPSAGLPSGGGVASENTIKSKTGSNDDVSARMAMMEEQRKKEFGGVDRK
jgi:hypothetical protein